MHSRLPRGVRPRLEGKQRTALSSRARTRISWSPLSRLKGVQPTLQFGERTRDCSPGQAGKEGPQLARTGASQGTTLKTPLRGEVRHSRSRGVKPQSKATQGAPRYQRRDSGGERSPLLPLEARPDFPGEHGMQARDPCLPWRGDRKSTRLNSSH